MMPSINIKLNYKLVNPVYRPYIDDMTPLQIVFGGSSSGKSVFVAQRCVYDIMKGGRNYLVIRNTATSIDGSVFNEIIKCITQWELNKYFKIHNTKHIITCTLNNYQIIMKGLDDVQKTKSITPVKGVITDIWIEEATETSYNDYKELGKRIRGIGEASDIIKREIFSFNPIMKTHWIFKEFFGGCFSDTDKLYHDEKKLILKTTHTDNEYLTEQDRAKLEDETDPYFHNVYTLGNWGVLGDLIFKNYVIEDLSDIRDKFDNYKNGLDFGFTNDPTAAIRSAIRGNDLFITHAFQPQMFGATNPVIAEALKVIMPEACLGKRSTEKILADPSSPRDIEDLRINYYINIYKAISKPGAVNYGINWLKKFNIHIDKSLQDVINEVQLYQWSKNKDGETTNIPIDKFNHFIDALRYSHSEQSLIVETEKIDPRKYGIYV